MLVNPAGVLVERRIRDREQERRHSRVARPHLEDPYTNMKPARCNAAGNMLLNFIKVIVKFER